MVEPGDADYDHARAGWNGAIDRRPAAVALASDADDVAAAVRAARADGLAFTIRGGGHSVAGRSVRDGALCIDLRALNAIEVDPVRAIGARRRRRAAGRARRRDPGARARGARPGQISHTGVGGLTLGGGLGWLMRHHGLTIDSLLARRGGAGRRQHSVRGAPSEHPDLFWALRGGGGDFAVVTSFEFRAHRVGPMVLGGHAGLPVGAGAASRVRASRELMADGARTR